MKLKDVDFVLVPGKGGSPEGHWQRRWHAKLPNSIWVQQRDVHNPDADEWTQAVLDSILHATRPVVLVGHSLGNHTISRVAAKLVDTKVRGAILVAAPNLDGPEFPQKLESFKPFQSNPLPFPSLYISSDNDKWCDVAAASEMASSWGSDFHVTPEAGHIDIESGHGLWPDGMMMIARLLKRI